MSKGAPDYSKMVLLQALDSSGNLIPVLLDSSGKIISVLQGIDGATLRTIAVDSSGQLITILKGASGNNVAVDASGFMSSIMKGNNAGSLVTIAVDASGNIIGVLKGDYSGTLKTIAVDADGRMLAKIYDPQDLFGANTVIGLAELAARLGSPMTFDRRGQLAWYDDFENAPLKWLVGTSGLGAAVALDNTVAFLKSQSVKLTAGSDASAYAQIIKYFPYIQRTRLGIEFTACIDTTQIPNFIELFIDHHDGAERRWARLQWDLTLHDLSIYNESAAYTVIDSEYPPVAYQLTWHKFKIVVDLVTGYYVRVMYGNKIYDASAIQCRTTAAVGSAYLVVSLRNSGGGGNNLICWVDDVVITQNEP